MENESTHTFLLALYRITGGDTAATCTMQTVGAAIGMDKATAAKTGEELIGNGWAEIKTLSGGIAITADGIAAARAMGATAREEADGRALSLGPGPLLDPADRKTVETLLAQIRQDLGQRAAAYENLEEMMLDLKTTEVHLLSPRAKTTVVKALLGALQTSLQQSGHGELSGRIQRMIQS